MNEQQSKVWYITGASKGLGLALIKLLLNSGHRVAATSRTKADLISAVGAEESAQFLPLEVDLTDDHSVETSLAQTQQHFGALDVIVNNAGYGIAGAIEELNMQEIKQSVDINLLASVRIIHYAMPYLRQQRSGHIINISSIGGFTGSIGWAMYAASKFAVFGYTEVLAQDVKELGIKATVVAPGAFRTSFLAEGDLTASAQKIDEYTVVHASHQRFNDINGKQIGDPDKAAQAMIDLVANPEPPVVLFLGSDAYARASQKINDQRANLEKYKAITDSTDYPKA